MKKIVFIFNSLIILFSATAFGQTEKDIQELEYLINPSQLDSLTYFINSYEKIKTEQQFSQFYHTLLPFKNSLSKSIEAILKSQNNETSINDLHMFFKNNVKFLISVEAESGIPFYLQLNNEFLSEKANKTIGKNDDRFMEIILLIYGNFGEANSMTIPSWMHERSYVSISSRLGDLTSYNIYKRLKTEIRINKLFENQLLSILGEFKRDLTLFSAFDYKRKDVIKELKKIRTLDYNLKTDIDNYINKITICPDFQFDCNQGNCKFEN